LDVKIKGKMCKSSISYHNANQEKFD